ncbi:GNAT family N-acetyltransferase [Hymenobacter rubripertinctus]|uniref:N-acetyltransferase n=1 Tax=Hymenobacter rubripertinctus TaxID=2029981 RepID=A0A418QKS0_9BACT|nr:GNAT family protein [Hymenobacter rubripertinctus]RIY05700.1 N-acetyltransferase [Hymenobacter rubripertinctus]
MPNLPAPDEGLTTPRLLLRPWQPPDAAVLLQLIETDRTRLLRDFPKTTAAIQDLASAARFIADKMADWSRQAEFQLSIWEKASGQCIGFISFKNVEWSVPRAELAYLVASGHEGQGLMTEAGRAAVRWAFEQLRMERLYCHASTQNARSLALALRLGLQREGVLRHNFRGGDGQLTDSVVSGLIKADFSGDAPQTA